MHDIRLIRDDPAAFDAALARRRFAASSAEILALDEKRRAAATKAQELLARRNEASKAIYQGINQILNGTPASSVLPGVQSKLNQILKEH